MPFKTPVKKTNRKTGKVKYLRSFYKRKRVYLKSMVRGAGITGLLPRSKQMTLEYCTTAALAKTNAETSQYWAFKMNNLYDPETTNLGMNKPYVGWDQLATLYTRYKVNSLDVSVEMFDVVTSTVPYSIQFQDATYAYSNTDKISVIACRKGAISGLCMYQVPKHIKFHVDIRKQFALPKYAFDDNYVGLFDGTAPNKQCYMIIQIGEVGDTAVTATNVSLMVKIKAHVTMFSPIEAITAV